MNATLQIPFNKRTAVEQYRSQIVRNLAASGIAPAGLPAVARLARLRRKLIRETEAFLSDSESPSWPRVESPLRAEWSPAA